MDALDDLIDVGRRDVRDRLMRLRSKSFLIVQCAVAAGTAWWLAADVFSQPSPVFAPLAALAALGTSYAQRLKRVLQVIVGMVLGVFVADVMVHFLGTGAWQIALIVGLAIAAALYLHDSPLVVAEAGAQAVIVATVLPPPGVVFTRWIDTLIGGSVALVAAIVVPSAAIRKPGVQAAVVVDKIAQLLRSVAGVMANGQVGPALLLLAEARNTDHLVRELQRAAEEGLDILDSSPIVRWRHRRDVRRVAQVVVPLDRALRSTRVLVRQTAIAARHDFDVPASYEQLALDLADACDHIATELRQLQDTPGALPMLEAVAAATGTAERTTELTSEAMLAQLRSITVDLLMVTGLTAAEAMGRMPPPAPHAR